MHLIKRALQAAVALTAVSTLHQPLWGSSASRPLHTVPHRHGQSEAGPAEVKNVDAAKATYPKCRRP